MRSPTHRRSANARRLFAAASAACGLAAFAAPRADASLIIDVRATGGTGGTVVFSPKAFMPSAPGDTLTLAIFARVSGTNGINDETIQSAAGTLRSVGDAKGNMTGGIVAPFNGASSTNGSVQDFDSDGDLDLGSAGSTSTGKLFGRANSPTTPSGIVDANTSEIQIGHATWTYTGGVGNVDINYFVRTNATGGPLTAAALWFEDNNAIPTGNNPSNSLFAAGTPVQIIPEPASLGLLALASVGLLKRRTKQS